MKFCKKRSLLLSASILMASTSFAATQLSPIGSSIVLSDGSGAQSPDLNSTAKVKLVRLSNGGPTHGRLVSVFADASGATVYDVKAQAERPARDIYARYSDDDGVTWSDTINISNTAAQTSMETQWQGEDVVKSAFYGDSDKPNIFNSANNVVVSWVDKYCDPAAQKSVTYIERDMREVPFSCTYTARSKDGGKTFLAAERLSDGRRDAKADANKGSSKAWIVSWQEDPDGLKLGEADGPGDGASGANVSHGTDIWYSYVGVEDGGFANGTTFSAPVRVTNNWTKMEDKRNTGDLIESGQEGASRANIGLAGGTVVMAYEETKGSEGVDEGKYIRYHSFAFNKSPSTLANACVGVAIDGKPTTVPQDCTDNTLPPNLDMPERMGCILSKPEQNGRRVRFLPQATAGSSGTKLFIFWKEGEYSQGGPSDIVGRSATDFADLSSFSPALNVPTAGIADGCLIRGEDDAVTTLGKGAYANTAGLNLSHNTPDGGDLAADSDENPIEDARAHRGYIRGDTIVLGYSYTTDGVLARATDIDHYNFWIRRSLDGGATWDSAKNMSKALMQQYIASNPQYTSITQIDVKEPRIVKTPGNGPATCPTGDPEDPTTTDKSECSNPLGFIVSFGLVENTYEHLGGGEELDLFITRSTDAGATYETPIAMANTSIEEFESQIRMTPALDKVFSVWNSSDDQAGKNAHFIAMDVIQVNDEIDDEDTDTTSSSSSGSVNGLLIVVLSLLGLYARRRYH